MKMKQMIWIAAAMALMLFFVQGAVANTIEDNAIVADGKEIRAGVTPDSVFYFIDKFLDNRALKAAGDGAEKSRIGLKIARERLLETREMLETNKVEAAQKAQHEHSRMLSIVEISANGIEKDDALEQMEAEMEIEKELEEHGGETEFVKNELKLKFEGEGKLTPTQRALIDSLLSSMKNQTGNVKVKVEGKRDELRIRLKAETGKSDSEIDREITDIETRTGLRELKIEKAKDKLEDASEEIAEIRLRLAQANATNASLTAVTKLIEEAEQKLADAQKAFDEGKLGEAFGLANSAENLARNAKRMLQGFAEDNSRVEEKLEIRADVMDAASEIKVKLEFASTTTERQKIAEEILEKLNLNSEDLSAILEIESDDEDAGEDELADRRRGADKPEDDNENDDGNGRERMKTEARIRDGVTRVKFELRFPLNATDRSAMVNGIIERISRLSADEIAASLDIRLRENVAGEDAGENEIEVEVEEGIAKIKIRIGDSRIRYSKPFVSEAEIVKDIALKTRLSEEEVRKLMEIKTKADEEDEDAGEDELADRRRGADKPEDDNDEDELLDRRRGADKTEDDNGRGRGRG